MKRPFAYIAGTGHAVPKNIVTNADIAAMGIETDDQWIIERTGIRQRHIAAPNESLTSLAADASRQAMARAGVQPGEIDTIVLGTASPDHLLPATAVEVQTMLGCSRAAAGFAWRRCYERWVARVGRRPAAPTKCTAGPCCGVRRRARTNDRMDVACAGRRLAAPTR